MNRSECEGFVLSVVETCKGSPHQSKTIDRNRRTCTWIPGQCPVVFNLSEDETLERYHGDSVFLDLAADFQGIVVPCPVYLCLSLINM